MKYATSSRASPYWLSLVLAAVVAFAWLAYRQSTRLLVTVYRDQRITVDGQERTYRLVIPDRASELGPLPLLIALHGAGDTTEQMAEYTDLDRLSADHGVCVLYLQGLHDSWPPFIPEGRPEVIDRELAFFDAVCDEILSQYPIDRRQVYLTGMSQGAAFAHIILARRSERVAAAAVHSGWLPDPLGETGVDTANKCPILFIVGADDHQVSPQSVAKARDCFARAGHPTEWLELEGVGHRWAKDHGVNETIWRFLSQHTP